MKFATALNVLVALKREGIIDPERAEKSLRELETFGWYNERLIDRARRDLGAG